MGRKSLMAFILLIMGIGLISFGLFKVYQNDDSTKTDDSSNNNTIVFNGIYQNGDNVIKAYQKKDNTVYFSIETVDNNTVVSFGKIDGNKVSSDIFDNNYTLTLNDNIINLQTNNLDIPVGNYNKVKDYTINDYFNDNYGQEQYFNTKYNGEYSLNDIKAYLYQEDETIVRVYLIKGFNVHDLEYEINEDGHLSSEIFDDKYEIIFNDNEFTIKETSDSEKKFDGTYSKVKTLTMEDIINIFN